MSTFSTTSAYPGVDMKLLNYDAEPVVDVNVIARITSQPPNKMPLAVLLARLDVDVVPACQ